MKEDRKPDSFPYVGDPQVQQIIGQPETCWEGVNRWGTYNVQATQDTDNASPRIAQGYPKSAGKDAADPWNSSHNNTR